jgi:hemoglobin-like flavoprotein
MTSEQIALVKSSWRTMSLYSDRAADVFYDKLFELDGSLRVIFKNDLGEQKRKLMQSLGFVVANLNSPATLLPVVQHFGRRHAIYGAQPTLVHSAKEAFLFTLKQGLGPLFTNEVRTAWAAMLQYLMQIVQDAAREVSGNSRAAA